MTASTGNHGIAVAYAARLFETSVVVVVPAHAEPTKLERPAALGAEVRQVGTTLGEAIAAANVIASDEGRPSSKTAMIPI